MRNAIALLVACAMSVGATAADRTVSGYTNKNGTKVQPYKATPRNSSKADNHSQKGNVNPHTGKKGTKK